MSSIGSRVRLRYLVSGLGSGQDTSHRVGSGQDIFHRSGSYLSILSLLFMTDIDLGALILGNVLSFFPDGVPISKDLPQQYTRQGYVITCSVSVMKIPPKPKKVDLAEEEIPNIL
ncbi:hypothetical protein GEMRC1_013263 [Eukaryota sp. GEM-RC1]